jgi:hypothetical protein
VIRIRIVQTPPISGVDGIQFDCFEVGKEYQMGNTLGSLFLAEGWGEAVALDAPAPVEPFSDRDPFDSRVLYADGPPNLIKDSQAWYPDRVERDIAADYQWRRRTRKRR